MLLKNWSTKKNISPQRRMPERKYKDYKQYKRWLREDFGYRCGYCDIHENEHGGYWHFHVDHYRPKSRSVFKHLETEYSNLLYSCDHCNTLKSDVWPSDDPLNDGVGWLDPCEHNLKEHYYFGYCEEDFTLTCLTNVGKWMVTALALDQPARIRHRRDLAEEELIDIELIDKLTKLLEGLSSSEEYSIDIEELRQVLTQKKEKVQNRYTPKPFEALRRGIQE